MDNIVFREAGIDDAEEMISYLNIVGRESDNLMHGSNGFNVPIEAVKQRMLVTGKLKDRLQARPF